MFSFRSFACRIQCPFVSRKCFSLSSCFKMDLQDVVSTIERFAPTSLAEPWDNVGLLVEPSGEHKVKSILLTNDLTEEVLDEAVEKKVQMLISYHPPIFVPLKRLTLKSFKERIIVKAIEHRIAIYSPHTAFDAVHNGVNDWLASGLGKATVTPLHHAMESVVKGCTSKVTVTVDALTVQDALKIKESVNNTGHVSDFSMDKTTSYDNKVCNTVAWCCSDSGVLPSLSAIRDQVNVINVVVNPLSKVPIPNTGSGRLCALSNPVSLDELVKRVKVHLNIQHLRLATSHAGNADKIMTVALCAGSGASVLKGVKADVFLTGEMSHHEVLDALSKGTHVILCEHSNTERGFLKVFKGKLESLLDGKADVAVSVVDADPLQVV